MYIHLQYKNADFSQTNLTLFFIIFLFFVFIFLCLCLYKYYIIAGRKYYIAPFDDFVFSLTRNLLHFLYMLPL